MIALNHEYAERARALVGTPFRLQGRGIGGLDCVGVVLLAFGLCGEKVRRDYRLRGHDAGEVRAALSTSFRRVSKGQLRPGDLMVLRIGEGQIHLAVRTGLGFVHAHAGIRKVVETPGLPDWPLLGVYRKRRRS